MGLELSIQALGGGAAMEMGSRKGSSQRTWLQGCRHQAVVQQATYSHPIFAGAGFKEPGDLVTTPTRPHHPRASW